MSGLLNKFYEFKSIVNYKFVYDLEDGQIVDFKIKQKDFPHLVGLHKLIDILIIRYFNDKNNQTVSAKYIISQIKVKNFGLYSKVPRSLEKPREIG